MKNKKITKMGVPCETYSRVAGYFRPVAQWNAGKKEEYQERYKFQPDEIISSMKKKEKKDGQKNKKIR